MDKTAEPVSVICSRQWTENHIDANSLRQQGSEVLSAVGPLLSWPNWSWVRGHLPLRLQRKGLRLQLVMGLVSFPDKGASVSGFECPANPIFNFEGSSCHLWSEHLRVCCPQAVRPQAGPQGHSAGPQGNIRPAVGTHLPAHTCATSPRYKHLHCICVHIPSRKSTRHTHTSLTVAHMCELTYSLFV